MIAETIMYWCGWDVAWNVSRRPPSNSEPSPDQRWWHHFSRSCIVGVRTGPDMDMICVREARTRRQAWNDRSPEGGSILSAAVKSLAKLAVVKLHERVVSPLSRGDSPSKRSGSSEPSAARRERAGSNGSPPNKPKRRRKNNISGRGAGEKASRHNGRRGHE